MDTKRIFLNIDFEIRFENSETGCNIPFLTYHDLYEIYILTSGERTTVVNDKLFTSLPSTAALFSSYALHRSFGNVPYSGICFLFSDNFLNEYYSLSAKNKLLKCFKNPLIQIDKISMDSINELCRKVQQNPESKFLYLGNILDIFCSLSASQSQILPLNNSKTCDSKKIADIMNYLNNNFTKINSFNSLCDMFDISEGYLYRAFKKQTGMTISQYVNTLKIQYACHMLSDKYSIKTVSYIADTCGFDSASYFVRTFKKFIGCTPTEYRNSIHK